MNELDFYIKKFQEIEPRGEWKDVFTLHFEKTYELVYQSHFTRRNFYIEELRSKADTMLDLPFSLDDDERLTFRKTQKQITDLLYLIKTENKKIIIVHGSDTSLSDKISSTLGKLKLDYIDVDYASNKEKEISQFIETTKSCEFAIITLSKDEQNPLPNRTNQNVWFQFGYLLSQLGRRNILLSLQEHQTIDSPIHLNEFEQFTIGTSSIWKQNLIQLLVKQGIYIEEELKNKISN
ncbi:MAG: hypothetical protein EAZ07_05185 [Cytophagales bacterium]|nr:MAG: hypothetical protein EAZ07_05185 [Cytophagales bacterium]